jgi:type I restriction enzyme S subunit
MRVKLKDITKFSKGTQINGKNLIDDGAYSYLNGGINPSGKWNEFNVAENTVTISEGGNSSGYVNYMNKAFWCGAHCYYLYDGPKNSKYLYYALKSQQERLFRIRSGACMPNIKKSDLGNFIIEYEEDETRQEEVVKVLEKCELLIEDYNKKLALLDEAVRARFVEMFGDPVDNPMNWKKKKLKDIVTEDCTISYGIVQTGEEQKEGIPVFRPVDIVNHTPKVEELKKTTEFISDRYKKTLLKGHELLITVRANIADTFIADKEFMGCNVGRGIVPIRTQEDIMRLEFLKCLIDNRHLNDILKSKAKGITLIQLNMEDLRNVELIIPPIDLQIDYLKYSSLIDKSRLLSNHSLLLLKSIIF